MPRRDGDIKITRLPGDSKLDKENQIYIQRFFVYSWEIVITQFPFHICPIITVNNKEPDFNAEFL